MYEFQDLAGALAPDPSSRPPGPDAHGQAALLLAESMLHALVEAGRLTRGQALDAVRTAVEVKEEVAEEAGESNTRMRASLDLLHAIEHSLASIDPRT